MRNAQRKRSPSGSGNRPRGRNADIGRTIGARGLMASTAALVLLVASSSAEPESKTRLVEVRTSADGDGTFVLHLVTSQPVRDNIVFALPDPPRLVIDLPAAQNGMAASRYPVEHSGVTQVRIGQHASKLRVVVDAEENELRVDQFEKSLLPNGLRISLPLPAGLPSPVMASAEIPEKEVEVPPSTFASTLPAQTVPYSPPVLPPGLPLPPLPDQADLTHLGVASCSGAPCHGSAVERDSNVLQTEYIIWRSQDRHSVAYTALYNDQSKTIARNLNLPHPPHEEKLCLDCHADNVAASLRGERFSIEDGIGCEGCHGGGGKYITGHDYLQTNAENITQGMYPTEDPVARAELCLSCHYGTVDKPLRHRLIGAGHPRLAFELQTFTYIQPAHFRHGRDYTQPDFRSPDGVAVWAAGQAVASRKLLDELIDSPGRASDRWPEFVNYNCFSCHQQVDAASWRTDTPLAQGAGTPAINTANLDILQHAIAAAAPASLEHYRTTLAALRRHANRPRAGVASIALALREQIVEVTPQLAAWSATPETTAAALQGVLRSASAVGRHDFLYAEQAVMALQVLIDQLDALKALPAIERSLLRERMDALLASLANPERYDASRTRYFFDQIAKSLP